MTKEATELLALWARGDEEAGGRLMPLIYEDLRRIARRHLSGERTDHTLDPTALVHEAWLRFEPRHAEGAANRKQYLALASSLMRSLLVDHARRRDAEKRGGRRDRITLGGVDVGRSEYEVLVAHELVEELTASDAELGRIAELRVFGGLTQDEIADVLGLAKRTLERRWRVASAWLRRELER